MSCKAKLSGFIFGFPDCQKPEPDSEKWPDIWPELDTAGYLAHPSLKWRWFGFS